MYSHYHCIAISLNAYTGSKKMSEELLQTIHQQIGNYTYLKLGSTTLNQLKANGLIPKKNYGKLSNKKPDGLVFYQNVVKAVVEYKHPTKLKSELDLNKAIKQEIDVAKTLCKILIITDGTKSYWINALNRELIKDSNGHDVKTLFNPITVQNTDQIEYLLSAIDASINSSKSLIKSTEPINPTPLASRLWQTIWVATGKSPVKCLYNVVELFIFKFLSDLNVLNDDVAFEKIYQLAQDDPTEALDYYARNTRNKIYKLFPAAKDGTTIINGTIFVNEQGDANLSQSILFLRSLEHLQKYSEEVGSLTQIDKQFKTKLYESFLNQEVEALGQYFTPRKIVQSMIRMAGLDSPSFQFSDKRICDPFCGVGGFPLEILNLNENMKSCYIPKSNGVINLPFTIHGFDKGFERDDERTIILAKANMLIYLAELLFANPNRSIEFSRIFNNTFTLFKDNLGTFGHIIEDEDDKYDFIISNPPYVTSGSSIIKEEIRKTARTRNYYTINSLGLEGLAIEWIIKTLKTGGKAFIVIPDGILSRVWGNKLRDYIIQECYLDAIISLPTRTFFANFKHTYILVLTKKHDIKDIQTDPVFTYLVTNIGEKLTSNKREEIGGNKLPELEAFFKIFMGSKDTCGDILENNSLACKIQKFELFQESSHWVIDRWWNRDDKTTLGIEESFEIIDKSEIDTKISHFNSALNDYDDFIKTMHVGMKNTKEITLGDTSLFRIFIGTRILKKDLGNLKGDIPVYSANVFTPFGYISHTNIDNFDYPALLWGIDGNFEFNILQPKTVFATTDHTGTINILDDKIIPEYLLYALNIQKEEESFDRSFRASLTNMRCFAIEIPILDDGTFDVKTQKKVAEKFIKANEKKKRLLTIKDELDYSLKHYMSSK